MNQPTLDIDHEHERIDHALDGTPKDPSASDVALKQLQESIRGQIVAIAHGEITSKTMAQLQRFSASVGAALVTLEKPDALVRQRFNRGYPMLGGLTTNYDPYGGDYLGDDGSLAPAPVNETYGANTSRGLIESAAKIGKDLVTAQADAQRAARAPTLTEMITSLALAKNAKLPKTVLKVMEKQITDMATASAKALEPQTPPALPAPKRSKR